MRKIIALLIIFTVVFSFSACAKDNPAGPGTSAEPSAEPSHESNEGILEGSLESILQVIYDTADISDDFKNYLKDGVETQEITAQNIEYHLGKKGIEFKEAIASEPMIQPSAYSLCLIRVKEGADVEKIKQEIKDNVNPQKWVCVGVDEKNVIVDSIGDVIFLVMSDQVAKSMHDAFQALKG
jgi:hypothetical protein